MVVENSTAVRELIKFSLEGAGYKVVMAQDGADALNKIMEYRPDMIFSDLNMPNMNGIDMIRMIRKNPNSRIRFIPVVVVTTESKKSEKKEQAKAAGATAWITKPFKRDQLLSVVRKVLDS